MEAASASRVPMTTAGRFRMSAFGIEVDSDLPLPGMRAAEMDTREAELTLREVDREELLPLSTEPRVLRLLQAYDGSAYAMLEGADGDVLMCYGHRAHFHLSADRGSLRVGPAVSDDPHWQRVLLDTVLWTVSALEGFLLLHASAVETTHGVVAFVTATGGGKTSLAAELMRRGGTLFSDDIVALGDDGGDLLAYPGPPLMNLPLGLPLQDLDGAFPIAELGKERWVEIRGTQPEPRPLAALVWVERAPGLDTRCERVGSTPIELLPHTFGFSHTPELSRARFELGARVVAATPQLSLTADLQVQADALADLVDARLASS
jgi:hypothetical protein